MIGLNVSEITYSYIVGVCKEKIKSKNASPESSLTLRYAVAKESLSFIEFQHLADFIGWQMLWFPKAIYDKDLALAFAQNSYYWCYRLTGRQLVYFEELADYLPAIITKFSSLKPSLIQSLLGEVVDLSQ